MDCCCSFYVVFFVLHNYNIYIPVNCFSSCYYYTTYN